MYSDHFPPQMIVGCDDNGIYYIRQLDSRDGVDFEGMVWFGQQFAPQPEFANVFVGRLQHGFRTDDHGNRVDRWVGNFFDIPKGRVCGSGDLIIESFVAPPNPDIAGCDFPTNYLVKVRGTRYGGTTWRIEQAILGCWEDAPAIPPAIAEAATGGLPGIVDEVIALGSTTVPAGFERWARGNLTGVWRSGGGATYYIRHLPETGEVVWYGESENAHPGIPYTRPPVEASGWANVFSGTLNGTSLRGMWADVPRGGTNGAGRLALELESETFLRITDRSGGFGGRGLWKVNTLDVTVDVSSLTIVRAQEGADEPLLYLFFFKLDGEGVDLDDLSNSHATTPDPQPPSIFLGTDVTGTVSVDPRYRTYATTLSTVRSSRPADVKRATSIGVIAYAIEVDEGYSNEFRRDRFLGWRLNQEHALNSSLRRGEVPSEEYLRREAQRITVQYLGPWDGWPWGDADDVLSGDVAMVTFAELEEAVRTGTGTLTRTLGFQGSGASYTASVIFSVRSRRNEACSDG